MKFFLMILALIFISIVFLRIDFLLGLRKLTLQNKKTPPKPRMGNVTLLSNGKDFFDYLFADIERAEHHIHLQTYIYQEDDISNQLTNLLIKKAKEGVEVRLLIDWFGSNISKKSIAKLRDAGVEFFYSEKPHLPFLFFSINHRNHRKITVIDGEIGYIGGFNIGDEYLGRNKEMGFWRDFHLHLKGDGVQDLQRQFIYDWQDAAKKILRGNRYYPILKEGQTLLKFLPTNGTFFEETLIEKIDMAKRTILIGTPYYIPGRKLQDSLIHASRRGVKVTLFVPKKSDYPLIKEASFPYFKHLLLSGVNIYEYKDGFYHAKALVIDQFVCKVGTANLDKRSFYLNKEMSCFIYDKQFHEQVTTEMLQDIKHAKQLTLTDYEQRPLWQKTKEKIAILFDGLL